MSILVNMKNIPILDPTRKWECPSCGRLHMTKDQRVITPMHSCPKLNGIMTPYVEIKHGHELKKNTYVHRVIEREDYVGKEKGIMTDRNGKAIMAIHTERESGHDTTVFPGTATLIAD